MLIFRGDLEFNIRVKKLVDETKADGYLLRPFDLPDIEKFADMLKT